MRGLFVDQAHRALIFVALLGACAGEDPTTVELDAGPRDAGSVRDGGVDTSQLPFAQSVESFDDGALAGFGQERMPSVVLGPPRGSGTSAGSIDVVSLGVGGEIVLGFGAHTIVDGPGPDFVVFENAFWVDDDPNEVFFELGEVSVSTDAATWRTFACDAGATAPPWTGCAGWSPTLRFEPFDLPLLHDVTGGDAFDLAEVGLDSARYVRIRDLSTDGAAPSAGFDLDAVGILHFE